MSATSGKPKPTPPPPKTDPFKKNLSASNSGAKVVAHGKPLTKPSPKKAQPIKPAKKRLKLK
jgi:hypothetical protein